MTGGGVAGAGAAGAGGSGVRAAFGAGRVAGVAHAVTNEVSAISATVRQPKRRSAIRRIGHPWWYTAEKVWGERPTTRLLPLKVRLCARHGRLETRWRRSARKWLRDSGLWNREGRPLGSRRSFGLARRGRHRGARTARIVEPHVHLALRTHEDHPVLADRLQRSAGDGVTNPITGDALRDGVFEVCHRRPVSQDDAVEAGLRHGRQRARRTAGRRLRAIGTEEVAAGNGPVSSARSVRSRGPGGGRRDRSA